MIIKNVKLNKKHFSVLILITFNYLGMYNNLVTGNCNKLAFVVNDKK